MSGAGEPGIVLGLLRVLALFDPKLNPTQFLRGVSAFLLQPSLKLPSLH